MTERNSNAQRRFLLQENANLTHTEQTIAKPEPKEALVHAIQQCELLGETQDNKRILLYKYASPCALMNEIGRLREESFRLVGEGTGNSKDIDHFDPHYEHIVLWDNDQEEVVGAYRLKGCDKIVCEPQNSGILDIQEPLYTQSLFQFNNSAGALFREGLELGRSFVQPKYWGSRSLEYLWYGIAAYLKKHPEYRFLFGAVSISSALSAPAQNLLIYFYQTFFGPTNHLSHPILECRQPFHLSDHHMHQFEALFQGKNERERFLCLKKQLRYLGFAVPVLYKQYAELTDTGGTQFLGFNIDPEFNHCIDGFVVVDIDKMTDQKRSRYQLEGHRLT